MTSVIQNRHQYSRRIKDYNFKVILHTGGVQNITICDIITVVDNIDNIDKQFELCAKLSEGRITYEKQKAKKRTGDLCQRSSSMGGAAHQSFSKNRKEPQ